MLLLDTDVMIDLLRRFPPAVAWLETQGSEELVLPGFVVLELLQGCRDKSDQDRVHRLVMGSRVVWPTDSACNIALQTYTQFHLSQNLGFLDALIAQTAIALGLPLYTFNQKHYSVIPGLATVQPYAR